MICKNCGQTLDNDALFCTMCGTKTENLPEAPSFAAQTGTFQEPAAPDTVVNKDMYNDPAEIVTEPEMREPGSDNAFGSADTNGGSPSYKMSGAIEYERPKMQTIEEKPQNHQKEFFGTAAFVLCVSIIAMLSMSTGVFAALYFRAIGA